jgi:hypothetical protein
MNNFKLDKPQIVRDVILTNFNYCNTIIKNKYAKITIKMDIGDLILTSYCDCSRSWFEEWNFDFKYLIGKKIKNVIAKVESLKLSESNFGDFDENYFCEILFYGNRHKKTEKSFIFILRSSSNGYYTGSIEYELIRKNEKINKLIKLPINTKTRISIFIGLPCSGKTTLMKNIYPKAFHYDDYLNVFYPTEIINNILSGRNHICFADPRLCDYSLYIKLFEMLIGIIDKNYIQTILFENDVDSCINNFNKTPSKNPKISNDIKIISKNYSTDKEYINSIVIPVYKE